MSSISEKEYYHLTISINKALNPMETPLKMKHARSAIITTHRTKEAKSFWAVITRQPLMENRFTAWKFCHLLHKVLREGHPNTLKHSQTHKKMIFEMGKLWGHLQDGVGSCIQAYSKLIVTKLDFHDKNSLFPGSLLIDFRQVEKFAGDDINIYFQLGVEIFDYLDDIDDVQSKVFTSINTYRMSSMTPQGQCRLAPLITLIQDSNPLYDLCVRIMFKLHDQLPSDILSGHRDRFRELFTKLKNFYNNVRPLQYFSDLIQVPHLPETAPNFTSKVDFGSYIPPVMFVQPDPEPAMDNLVDTSISAEQPLESKEISDIIELKNVIRDGDLAIQVLQSELTTVKQNYNSMEDNCKKAINQLRDEVSTLSNELSHSKEICGNLRALNNELELKLASEPIIMQKAAEEQEKAKTSEEKFKKLKILYNQIRDEHINLLRQHSDSVKFLDKEKQVNSELKTKVQFLETQLIDFDEQKKKEDVAVCNKNTEIESQLKEMASKYETLLLAHNDIQRKCEKLENNNNAEVEKLTLKTFQLQEELLDSQQTKSKNMFLEKSLSDINDEFHKKEEELSADLLRCKADLESKKTIIADLKSNHEFENNSKNSKIDEIQQSFSLTKMQLDEQNMALKKLTDDKLLLESEIQDLIQHNSDLDNKLKIAHEEAQMAASSKHECEIKYESIISSILHTVLKTMEIISTSKTGDSNQQSIEKTLKWLEEMENILNEVSIIYRKYHEDKSFVEGLARKCILLGYSFTMLHEQCLVIYHTSTDIEKAQEVSTQINGLCEPLIKLFQLFHNMGQTENVDHCIQTMKSKLYNLNTVISALMNALTQNVELGELVETELAEMDKAIEDAAQKFVELLSSARSKDNGVKLEVNEKILDACTTLMECIKQLIRKSKILQEEIVSAGRGSTSIKEFYKRNSQWTEGLISASKSVAKGANLLVEAANKAIISESGQNYEIIVAAQEIAACTVQLVMASKVKAPRESQKLVDLTKASRDVSQATGAVVATVKDCNQHLEQSQEIDVSKLTASQAKTMEIEIHVKVLELEQALQLERLKLSSFRRNHYHQITEN